MKYRSTVDIQSGILEVTKYGARKTQIKYRANLTSRQLKGYIEKLKRGGLIQYDSDGRLCKITDKGLKWLHFADFVENTLKDPVQS